MNCYYLLKPFEQETIWSFSLCNLMEECVAYIYQRSDDYFIGKIYVSNVLKFDFEAKTLSSIEKEILNELFRIGFRFATEKELCLV